MIASNQGTGANPYGVNNSMGYSTIVIGVPN
jgi:hypothetical protein